MSAISHTSTIVIKHTRKAFLSNNPEAKPEITSNHNTTKIKA